jgi:hypothetical protein
MRIYSVQIITKKRNISSFKELKNFGKATPDGVVLPEGFQINKKKNNQIAYTTKCSNVLGENPSGNGCSKNIYWKPNSVQLQYINHKSEYIINKQIINNLYQEID